MTQLIRTSFYGAQGGLRQGWWVVIFLGCLLAGLAPMLAWSVHAGREVSLGEQALLILAVTWACQRLRGERLQDATGRFDWRWPLDFSAGAAAGAALMLLPALVLLLAGAVEWQVASTPLTAISAAVAGMLLVAVAEELLFRGFLFQRLLSALGVWPAQLTIAGLFLLTHLQNPGMTGGTKWIAGVNIFAASLLFGFAYLRTRSLALPIGLHWMANAVQGPILGFGVSGNGATGLLQPTFYSGAEWLTGGRFGLEASVPATVLVIAAVAVVSKWAPRRRSSGLTPP